MSKENRDRQDSQIDVLLNRSIRRLSRSSRALGLLLAGAIGCCVTGVFATDSCPNEDISCHTIDGHNGVVIGFKPRPHRTPPDVFEWREPIGGEIHFGGVIAGCNIPVRDLRTSCSIRPERIEIRP